MTSQDAGSKKRIDVHHHIYPPAFLAEELDRVLSIGPGFPSNVFTTWTPKKALDDMDQNDVQASVVSISTPGVWYGDNDQGRRLARICNDYGAELVKRHPKRFGMFGAIPLPDIEGSLKEIEYCLDVLGFDGIGIMTSYGRRWPGDEAFKPVFEELNRRNAVIHFHPNAPTEFLSLVPDIPPAIAEFPFDTTRAVMNLIYSGRLSQNPNIRCIVSHGGGTVPFLADRIASLARRPTAKHLAERIPLGVEHELRKLYYDVVSIAGNPPGMAALQAMAAPDRLLLGSDFPYASIKVAINGLSKLGLPAAMLADIERENALKLFPRLRSVM